MISIDKKSNILAKPKFVTKWQQRVFKRGKFETADIEKEERN